MSHFGWLGKLQRWKNDVIENRKYAEYEQFSLFSFPAKKSHF